MPVWLLGGRFLAAIAQNGPFLSDPGVPGVRSMGPVLSHSRFADLTDVTLVDEDTKSILTDNANMAIKGNMAMHVTQPKSKFITKASGYGNVAIWWPNLQSMKLVPSGS